MHAIETDLGFAAKSIPNCFRGLAMLESRHKVIGKTNDNMPVRLPLRPLHPEIENTVDIDVRPERTDTIALNGSCLSLNPLALFEPARLEPFLDPRREAPVRYTLPDKFLWFAKPSTL